MSDLIHLYLIACSGLSGAICAILEDMPRPRPKPVKVGHSREMEKRYKAVAKQMATAKFPPIESYKIHALGPEETMVADYIRQEWAAGRTVPEFVIQCPISTSRHLCLEDGVICMRVKSTAFIAPGIIITAPHEGTTPFGEYPGWRYLPRIND